MTKALPCINVQQTAAKNLERSADPKKLGIENADFWKERLNQSKSEQSKTEQS